VMESIFRGAARYLDGVEFYYFHNAIFGEVHLSDRDGDHRFLTVAELVRRNPETRVIIVGDAWMGRNDLLNGGLDDCMVDLLGGEYLASEADVNPYYARSGYENFAALRERFPHIVWLNPVLAKDRKKIDGSGTIEEVERIIPMYDLTLRGIDLAVTDVLSDEV